MTSASVSFRASPAENPSGFQNHPAYSLLDSVATSIEERVPSDPDSRDFNCATLGYGGRFRRVKRGLPNRYRLFFQFRSGGEKTIIYVWLNDEWTLRKEGSKTDVYKVFLALVKDGSIPNTYDQLLKGCRDLPKSGLMES